MASLSSPNRIVWEYFISLKELVKAAEDTKDNDKSRRFSALAVIMAVTVAEVFLNIWFRVKVEESGDIQKINDFLKELESRKSLEYKLKNWPKRYLARGLSLDVGPGKDFSMLKELRNSIVHFTSSHESVEFEGVVINGLSNTKIYDTLNYAHALSALIVSKGLIGEIFNLSGIPDDKVVHHLHAWTGMPPNIAS